MAGTAPREAVALQFGTSQAGRSHPALDPASAPLDDRDVPSQLARLRALAAGIAWYDDATARREDDWRRFFPEDAARAALAALAAGTGGAVPPHLALLIAWLEQAEDARGLLNTFTARHLQFQMRRVLGFENRPPVPDRVHLLLALKKDTAAVEIGAPVRFGAGRDARKVEQVFRPVRPVVVNHARVESLHGVSLDEDGRLRFAPVADSSDGLGTPPDPADRRWAPFGRRATAPARLPPAPVGFAIASPLLRLAGGERHVRLHLVLDGLGPSIDAAAIAGALQAHVSTAEGWSGPHGLVGSLQGDRLTLSFVLGPAKPAVVGHAAGIHHQRFPEGTPVVQLLLGPDARYAALAGLRVRSAQVGVDVRELRAATIENDEGDLDPGKPFLAFGAQPTVGSRLHVGCDEALDKPLTSLRIRIEWQAAPLSLQTHYAGYGAVAAIANGVAATVTWQDAQGEQRRLSANLLGPQDAGITTLEPVVAAGSPAANGVAGTAAGQRVQALLVSGSSLASRQARLLEQASPVMRLPAYGIAQFFTRSPSSTTRPGFVTITLTEDFLHSAYRNEAAAKLLPPSPSPLKEPYTPRVRDLQLAYEAVSPPSRIDEPSEQAFTDSMLQFFHVDAFGVAREHAWLNHSRPWAPQDGVSLLPRHGGNAGGRAGELMIGLSGVGAGDPVSLLLQVADGTADPQAKTGPLAWSVLADDAWRPLATGELVLDATHHLRRSGIVSLVLPDAHLTGNARMPPALVWLRASSQTPDAACDLVGVHANAVEAVFEDRGNDPARLDAPLPAGSVTKLATPLASVKSVEQPYASFGGAPAETDLSLAQRASERLRHRQRAIAPWDWERLVLQAFPSVARAKCVPHASAGSWQAPGHVLMLVVPDLRHRNAVDPLRPRVDLDTLERIREYLLAHAGMALELSVRNPRYVPVQVEFRLRMKPGYAFTYYRGEVQARLLRALSPWAFDGETHALPDFGGRVLRARLLDIVEALPFVDFVTDFKLRREGDPADRAAIEADTPDAILVSAPQHAIAEVQDG